MPFTVNFRATLLTLSSFFCLVFCLAGNTAFADHRIVVHIEGYEGEQLFLAYHLWDKQYIQDTATANGEGNFVFSGEENLPPGVYMVVMQPDHNYLQILVDQDQHFQLNSQVEGKASQTSIEGSQENALFYDYLRYLETSTQQGEIYQKKQKDGSENQRVYGEKLQELREEVHQKQVSIMEGHPNSFTAAMVEAAMEMDVPEFQGTEAQVRYRRWQYAKKHFFDGFDLGDHRLLRTALYFQRVDYYLNSLRLQAADSLIAAVDYLLEEAQGHEDNYKVMMVHLFNRFADSRMIGFDGVYVHMADQYYSTGKTPWVEKETLHNILQNADRLRPTLIGKKAPNFSVKHINGDYFSLFLSSPSAYKVLFFWESDCDLCQDQLAALKALSEKYGPKELSFLSVVLGKPDALLEQSLKKHSQNKNWEHSYTADKTDAIRDLYAINGQYKIYLLDDRGMIVMKDLNAVQLSDYLK